MTNDPPPLPRLLYAGDVPVEASAAGALLLHRLLVQYPPGTLRVRESNLGVSRPERRLPGVDYGVFPIGRRRLLHSRLHAAYSPWLIAAAGLAAAPLVDAACNFGAGAILTVAHGYGWLAAAAAARRLNLPLHLIVHDDWAGTVPIPRTARPLARQVFGRVYRAAASRLCVSPGMAEEYARVYGAAGEVLYPSRGPDSPVPRVRRQPQAPRPFTVAYAGSLWNRGFVERLEQLALRLARLDGWLDLYTDTPSAAPRCTAWPRSPTCAGRGSCPHTNWPNAGQRQRRRFSCRAASCPGRRWRCGCCSRARLSITRRRACFGRLGPGSEFCRALVAGKPRRGPARHRSRGRGARRGAARPARRRRARRRTRPPCGAGGRPGFFPRRGACPVHAGSAVRPAPRARRGGKKTNPDAPSKPMNALHRSLRGLWRLIQPLRSATPRAWGHYPALYARYLREWRQYRAQGGRPTSRCLRRLCATATRKRNPAAATRIIFSRTCGRCTNWPRGGPRGTMTLVPGSTASSGRRLRFAGRLLGHPPAGLHAAQPGVPRGRHPAPASG